MPTETEVNEAHRVLRADYWSDVRDVAEEFIKMWNAGDFDDRDEAIEWIDQSVDGAARVIYTAQAADCLRYSDHDDAGIDELGAEAFNFKDGMPWSALAYFAFRADIIEQIGCGVTDLDGVDINDDPPSKEDIAEAARTQVDGPSEVQS
jgi:hypothetical protein